MKHFVSSDFILVSVLVFLGYKVDSIDRRQKSRAEFYITKDDGLDESIEAFWNGWLSVEPKRFCAIQKELKTRLYS